MPKDNILLTIAARGGSKGVKNKNIRDLCGQPLIAYTIQQAQRWGRADKIICTTDSDQIADVARKFGVEVPFKRPAHLANDTVGKLNVLRHALTTIEEMTHQTFSILVDLDVSAPIRKISDIDNSLDLFLEKKAECVFSVVPCRKNPYFNMVEINGQGFVRLCKTTTHEVLSRQDAPQVYDMNASIYVYDRNYLLDEKNNDLGSGRIFAWVMDRFSAFDIDNETDFIFVEFLISKKLVSI